MAWVVPIRSAEPGPHLVAESARTAVEHDQHLSRPLDAKRPGHGGVVHTFGRHHLDLEVVVPRAQGAELLAPAGHGPGAHLCRIGSGQTTAALGGLEILRPPVAMPHAPATALTHHVREVGIAEPHEAPRADSGRHRGEERIHQLGQSGADLGLRQRRAEDSHPTVDVEADAAGRDHPVLGAERRHAADREAVAPVPIGHAEGRPLNAGKTGDVRDLLDHAASIAASSVSEA